MSSLNYRLLQNRIARFENEGKDAARDRAWLTLLQDLETANANAQAVYASVKPFSKLLDSNMLTTMYRHGGMVENIVAVAVNTNDQKQLDKVESQHSASLVGFASARFALKQQIDLVIEAHNGLLNALSVCKQKAETERFSPPETRQAEQTAFFLLKDLQELHRDLVGMPNGEVRGVDWATGAIQRECLKLAAILRDTAYLPALLNCLDNRSATALKMPVPSVRFRNLHLVAIPDSFETGQLLLPLCNEISSRFAELQGLFDGLKSNRGRVDVRSLSDQVLRAQYNLEGVLKAGLAYDRAICEYNATGTSMFMTADALRPYLRLAIDVLPKAVDEACAAKIDERNRAMNNCLYAESLLSSVAALFRDIDDFHKSDTLFGDSVYASARRYHELNALIRQGELKPLAG